MIHASPAVRRFARELGVDLSGVSGSARKGRVTRTDVQDFVKRTLSNLAADTLPAATITGLSNDHSDPAQFGEIELKPLSRLQKISGPRLHRTWLKVPMVTQHDEADITALEAFRQSLKAEAKQHNVRITLLAFAMKAVAQTLQVLPQFCSSLAADGAHLIIKKYCHLGVAVNTPDGLVVPVLRHVDQKSLFTLSAELMAVSARARAGKLKAQELQGGCFSLSSLGGIGGSGFTPLINAPEVAILGLSQARLRPIWNSTAQAFQPRLMLPLDLTYDHRVIDGAAGAQFIVHFSQQLNDARRLLL